MAYRKYMWGIGALAMWVGLLLLAGGAARVSAQEKVAARPLSITIPPNLKLASFDLVEDKIVLKVRLNDKISGNMILDTGANTCLLPQDAQRVGLELKPFPDAGENSQTGEITSLKIDKVALQKVKVAVLPIPLLDHWNQEHPHCKIMGLLGFDALQKSAVGLDFFSHTLGWWEGGCVLPQHALAFNYLVHLPDDAPSLLRVVQAGDKISLNKESVAYPEMEEGGVQTLPLYTQSDEGPFFLQARLDDIPIEFLLDTGSESMVIPEAESGKFRPLFSINNELELVDFKATGTTAILRSLKMGRVSFDFQDMTVIFPPKGKSIPHDLALFGLASLQRCRVIMDFPGKTLYVSPYADYNQTPGRTLLRSGLVVNTKDGKILGLFAGYPAVQAGLQIGDELLEVNGISRKTLFGSAYAVLQGKTLALRVRRKGRAEPLTFTLPLLKQG